MNQLSRENLNLVRLINRLDKHPNLNIKKLGMNYDHAGSPSLPQDIHRVATDQEKFDHNRYWELKSLETTIRHARSILDTINSNPSTVHTISQIQDPVELRNKLEKIQDRIDEALKTCTPPSVDSSTPLIYQIKPPEIPPLPIVEPEIEKEDGGSDDRAKETRKEEVVESKKEEEEERVGVVRERTTINQEEMTEELGQMASQLKKNVQHFNSLLAHDQAILALNQTKLESNSQLMTQQGKRLNLVSLKNRGFTWFSIAAVFVVTLSWILMFIIIRLT